MNEDWIFKVTDAVGTEYKIWASGRTEGFGPGHVVFNRIPQLIAAKPVTRDDIEEPRP